jgi:hypothetical protein
MYFENVYKIKYFISVNIIIIIINSSSISSSSRCSSKSG